MSHASRRLRLLALLAVCAACGSAAPPLACAAEPGAVDELGRALLAEARADDAVAYVTRLRRTLHASPEVKWQERETAGIVERALQELGLPYTSGVAGTGVVATLGSGEPVVALRADMDALLVDGRLLHACGHDAHMAMLLGAARLLKARQLPAGTVKLVFQPAEEGGAGAAAMVEAGAVAGVSAMFALHVMPYAGQPTGTLASRAGTIMAASAAWLVRFEGRGGHAALQHQNVDPVVAAAAAISALQTLVSRETSALDSAVISATFLSAGADGAFNVAPSHADVGGTLRALSDATFVRLQGRMRDVLHHVALAHGCNASLSFAPDGRPRPYPPTVNDAAAWGFARRVSATVFGEAAVSDLEAPIMAVRDPNGYARVQARYPFCFRRRRTLLFTALRCRTRQCCSSAHSTPPPGPCTRCTRRTSRWMRACCRTELRCTRRLRCRF
jgi:IAA-amino acid hydrolase